MAGKILKVSLNDVYGKVDDRVVVIFACFEHTKYMNNYVIFSFLGEYSKNKLCYGSIHVKKDSIVIFSVKDNVKQYIDEFINEYVNNNIDNFKVMDISNMEKVEIVSYNDMDYDKLQLLDEMSIVKEVVQEEEIVKVRQPVFLYILLFILILFACGLTLLYFKPELFYDKYKQLICTDIFYDNNLDLNYDIEKDIRFDKNNKVDSINVVRYYNFLDSNIYYEFKNSNIYMEFFNNGEGYKFIDEALQFRVIYNENSIIDDYDEMKIYLNREGFSCKEVEYEK